jgi:hypothetical protein
MEEHTKIEKKRATKYMPRQKKKEFQPPIADNVDLGFMDFTLVFSRMTVRFFISEITRTGD